MSARARRGAATIGLVAVLAGALSVGHVPAPQGADGTKGAGRVVVVDPQADSTPRLSHTPRPTPAPAAARARSASIVLSGDLLWHDTVWMSAAEDHRRTGRGRRLDLDPMFGALRPVVAGADVAVCHEEVPFAGPGEPWRSYPVFAAPPEIAGWIATMGWDACVTASNHSIDQGYDGLVRTADLLGAAGVRHVGTFRSPAERRRPVIVTTDDGVRVGLVAGTYGLNGFTLPDDKQWAVSSWDTDQLLAQARRARRAGADVVVVKLHAGDEYSPLPNTEQIARVRRLTASPHVDLVVGDHAHVVQPITRVNGKWVVYGMGNMVAQQETSRPRTYEGITVRFTFTERVDGFRVTRAEYLPTMWSHYAAGRPIRILRVVRMLARDAGDTARLREVRREVRAAVDGLGATPGLLER